MSLGIAIWLDIQPIAIIPPINHIFQVTTLEIRIKEHVFPLTFTVLNMAVVDDITLIGLKLMPELVLELLIDVLLFDELFVGDD